MVVFASIASVKALNPSAASGPEASTNTWGISGPTFLVGFTIASIVVIGGTALALGLIPHLGAGGADVLRTEPPPTLLALISGGEALALAVALADLRQRSLLGTDAEPRRRGSSAAGELTGLSRAVHDAVTVRGVPATIKRLPTDPQVAEELARTRAAAHALGLVMTPGQRRAQLWCASVPVILIAVGVVRVFAGLAHAKPVTGLIFLVAVAVAATGALLSSTLKRPFTPRGRVLLEGLRRDNRHLSPRLQPSWATYGPGSLLLGTALFGGMALFSADPAFAQSVGARMVPAAGLSSSGAPGSSGAAAGVCGTGGGGCGSGGSSCGGGGGCGGGGCGG